MRYEFKPAKVDCFTWRNGAWSNIWITQQKNACSLLFARFRIASWDRENCNGIINLLWRYLGENVLSTQLMRNVSPLCYWFKPQMVDWIARWRIIRKGPLQHYEVLLTSVTSTHDFFPWTRSVAIAKYCTWGCYEYCEDVQEINHSVKIVQWTPHMALFEHDICVS